MKANTGSGSFFKKMFARASIAALIFLAMQGANAQTPASFETKPENIDLAKKDDAEPRYLIGEGDVLDIRVFNRPQLSREAVRVDGKGMIKLPLIADEIRASCKTETELANEITKQYLEYLKNPHVEVFVKDFQSKYVAVIGAVNDPGRFEMRRRIRLLELLSFAGGPSAQAGGRIQIRHAAEVKPCEQSETENASGTPSLEENTNWFHLGELMSGKEDDRNNPYIRSGDIVSLVEADKIYIIGNVYRPAIIPLKEEKITLTQAVAIAGGTMPDTNMDRIRIMRQAPGQTAKTEIVADLKAIRQRKAEDIVLESNDIIEVPSSKTKKFVSGLINSIAPSLTRLPMRVIP